ncbi:hypothetical protein [Gordonia sp. 852002-50816_SCH5313054-c]|nr:hypothetical protein [Gordonia sp. 852002-50816_SCH5313054-c]
MGAPFPLIELAASGASCRVEITWGGLDKLDQQVQLDQRVQLDRVG